jgi:hypothetical protein
MKRLALFLFVISLTLLCCKKNTAPSQSEIINTNIIEAQVNISGRGPRTHSVKGQAPAFFISVDDNQNKIISIWGYDGVYTLELSFKNIDTGTYSFMKTYHSGNTVGGATYREGTIFSYTQFFSTFEPDTLGNNISRSSGSFTISRLTTTEIDGTMNAILINPDSTECHIVSGLFKGVFAP